jgi:hypothetical protein
MASIKSIGALVDIFVHGGMIPVDQHPAKKAKPSASRGVAWNSSAYKDYWRSPSAHVMNESCRLVCDEILYKKFDFINVDKAIETLASYRYIKDPKKDFGEGGARESLTAPELADHIAAFCKMKEIYWDDVTTYKTPAELKAYSDGSFVFGKALYDNKCFLSQNIDADGKLITATSKVAKSTRSPKVTTGSGAGVKDPYKSEGPQSAKARGLIGKPGDKIKASDIYVATIVGIVPGKKTRYTFIRPLGGSSYETSAGVNKVLVGDPSGYRDCQLFFESAKEAEAFKEKCVKEGKVPADCTDFSVRKQYADSNGYFKLQTEFGPALVKASKLNEDLIEEAEIIEESIDPIIEGCDAKFGSTNEEKAVLKSLSNSKEFCKDCESHYN